MQSVGACGVAHPSGGPCALPAGHEGPHSLAAAATPPPVAWGVPAQSYGEPMGRIDRTAAAALAIFGGSFGLHKFYRGKTGQGIIYLIFFWTYIPSILGMIEGLSYLLTSEVDWAAQHGGPPGHQSSMVTGCLFILAGLAVLGILGVIGLLFLGSQVSGILSTVGRSI